MNNFNIFKEKDVALEIPEKFRAIDQLVDLSHFIRKKIKVLVVVDTSISVLETQGFGVGRFIKLLRESSIGCNDFIVDIAVRPNVGSLADINFMVNTNISPTMPYKYIDFRFDSKVSNKHVIGNYHEIFMFGFAPDNSAGPDSNITNHPWNSTNAELKVMKDWMNAGGGVFATGDHDYLGASMCHRIPRVGTMRKWTNADGVPPINGVTRLDTNQPFNSNQENGLEIIPNSVEGDNLPQKIEWVPFRTLHSGLFVKRQPHTLLCHPDYGVIDVMPDHPHEGLCQEPDDIDFNANMKFVNEKEYPTFAGYQPKPKILAYGHVVARNNFAKGPVNSRRFPMISAYDGRERNTTPTGRVVVDSTWHHWFNMNISGLEADTSSTNWAKISRYYLNIARWLAPKNIQSHFCWWEVVLSAFDYPINREVNSKTPLMEVGKYMQLSLSKRFGECWVTQFVLDNICRVRPGIYDFYQKHLDVLQPPKPDSPECLTCPPFDVVELLVLGNLYRSLEPIIEKINFALNSKNKDAKINLNISDVEKFADKGIQKAMDALIKDVNLGIKNVKEVFK